MPIAATEHLKIGEAAAAAGLSAKMLRHYEAIGLLPRAARTTYSNYRLYAPNDVHALRFIRRARSLGFSIAEIKELLGLWRNRTRSSAAVKRIAGKHVADLKRKIAQLESMVATLEHLMRHCQGDHRPECPILDELAKR
jgi:Cu(I)-responsive transcriptional regulator